MENGVKSNVKVLGLRWSVRIFILTAFFLKVFIVTFYSRPQVATQLPSQQLETNISSRNEKIILLWTPYFTNYELWGKIFNRILKGKCPESRCRFVRKRTQLPAADAVLFYGANLRRNRRGRRGDNNAKYMKSFPRSRNPRQVWIFMSAESPDTLRFTHRVQLKGLDGLFNWTMTYRRDSDIVYPYGEVTPNHDTRGKMQEVEAPKKSLGKLVIWMASHCKAISKRDNFVKELRNYVKVDSYGKCGQLSCGLRVNVQNAKSEHVGRCDDLIKQYMFYLSLENSLCMDYVTEKFFRALRLGTVPVVLGDANYLNLAPPKSFIDAQDFASVKDLADYLIKVANDELLYQSYFEWRKKFTVSLYHPYNPNSCGLCEKLHQRPIKKVYENFENWFVKESKCHSWKQPSLN